MSLKVQECKLTIDEQRLKAIVYDFLLQVTEPGVGDIMGTATATDDLVARIKSASGVVTSYKLIEDEPKAPSQGPYR